jgi:hypothetical protein
VKHTFYQKSDSEQIRILWKFGTLLFLIFTLILVIAHLSASYLLGFLINIEFLIAVSVLDLSMGRKNGKFIDYSPLLISDQERENKIIVHRKTLFDYLCTIMRKLKSSDHTKYNLCGFPLGLINLNSEYENQDNENMWIRGTSNIINEKSVKQFGLHPVQIDFAQYLVLLFYYIPITISNSFIKQKLHFSNLSDISTYEGEKSEATRIMEILIQPKNQLEHE